MYIRVRVRVSVRVSIRVRGIKKIEKKLKFSKISKKFSIYI